MNILITGESNVGKTEILRNLKKFNVIYMDDYVKNILYKKELILKQINNEFKGVILDGKVNTKKLGKIVFSDEKKLLALEKIVYPYIIKSLKEWNSSKEIYLIEMATYLKMESKLKDLFNYKVLIKTKRNFRKNKFDYKNENYKPLVNNGIKVNLILENNNSIEEVSNKLRNFIETLY